MSQMSETQAISERIQRSLGNIRDGILRIWGVPFADNWMTLKSVDSSGDILRLNFNQGKLSIWCPVGLIADPSTFRIADGYRIRLEWSNDWRGLSSSGTTAIKAYFK